MNNKFPKESSVLQTIKINELLGGAESYYTLNDIMNILPESITINEHRGDMFISNYEISYFSVDPKFKINLICSFNIPLNGNIYDAFIDAIIYMQNNSILDV